MRKLIGILSLCIAVVIGWFVFSVRDIVPSATRVILHQATGLQQTNGRINILILGIGGGTHDGPDLTDTIIFASIDSKNNKVNLVSIPRDLWLTDVGNSGGKINEAYADKGLSFAKSVVQEVVGQPIHYGFRIDFRGFVKAIDLIGGVDVTVQNTLDDYAYPISGKEEDVCGHTPQDVQQYTNDPSATKSSDFEFFPCRYMHLHVEKGLQHMDGETALSFARSRHASGTEGTDFARSARQQLVIEAVRSKLLSSGTILDPNKITGLIALVKDSIDTDIPEDKIPEAIALIQKVKNAQITTSVIDYGDSQTNRPGLLMNPPISSTYNYAYVLIPRVGEENFSEIQSFITCELQGVNSCTIPLVSGTPIANTTKKVK